MPSRPSPAARPAELPPSSPGRPAGASRVCVGQIAGAHGVRGLVRVKSFTEAPEAVTAYGPPTDESGRRVFRLELLSRQKGVWLARIDGVKDRNAAEALRNTRLYVDRAALPPTGEDEFYHADLIGLPAQRPDGSPLGTVRAIHDFGAGDVIELTGPDGRLITVPFTRAAVPVVDPAGGRLVVEPPEELSAGPDEPEPESDAPDQSDQPDAPDQPDQPDKEAPPRRRAGAG
jgi:16S rRNA processing protein RimM